MRTVSCSEFLKGTGIYLPKWSRSLFNLVDQAPEEIAARRLERNRSLKCEEFQTPFIWTRRSFDLIVTIIQESMKSTSIWANRISIKPYKPILISIDTSLKVIAKVDSRCMNFKFHISDKISINSQPNFLPSTTLERQNLKRLLMKALKAKNPRRPTKQTSQSND